MTHTNNKTTSANQSNISSKNTKTTSVNNTTSTSSTNTSNCCNKAQNFGKNTFSSEETERRDGPGGE